MLLGVGVVVILASQLWSNFEKQGKADVYFYIAQGKARVLQYGQTGWDPAFSGTKFLIGDTLKTSNLGKVVLQFFNGTLIRLGPDTGVALKDVVKTSDQEKISVSLDNGVLWVNGKKSDGVKEGNYDVRTSHLLVRARGTVFEVESGMAEVVRVMSGEVKVDIIVNSGGSDRIAETVSVGVGQQITVDEAALKAFASNQTNSLLQAISEDFKLTDWYKWNIQEDLSPTVFGFSDFATQSGDANGVSTQIDDSLSQEVSGSSQTMQLDDSQQISDSVSVPKVIKPEGGKTAITDSKYVITGTVGAGVTKILVEQVKNGKNDSYALSKFKANDTSWSYNVGESLGNLFAGDNVYSFYAVDATGQKSKSAVVTISYNKPVISENLTPPVVKTYNGKSDSVFTVSVVKVQGEVHGAAKVVVDYLEGGKVIDSHPLSQFKPGDTAWTYFANENGGNLKPGSNSYQVYAIDDKNNRSNSTNFTITYNKPGANVNTPTVNTPTTQTQQ